MKQNLNYSLSFKEGFTKEDINPFKGIKVDLPHQARLSPSYHYFNDEYYKGTYTYQIIFDDEYPSLPIKILHLEGAMLKVKCYINSKYVGEQISGYLPIEFNLTNLIKKKDNVLTLVVISDEDKDIPPFGNLTDYLCFAGIYREMYLYSYPDKYISSFYVNASMSGKLDIHIDYVGETINKPLFQLKKDDKLIKEFKETSLTIENITPYSLENPFLYTFNIIYEGETYSIRIGFRDIEFKLDGFYLNKKKIKLIGMNRHQTYPYIGGAASKSLQEEDADFIKYKLGCNLVRTSHYPESEHFLSRCDEIGLLLIDEIPGWQHIGNEKWKSNCIDFASRMIKKERNHPCLISYGLRIDESRDDDELYGKINKIQKELDLYRCSLGVRNFKGSSLKEDIYAYNDFSCNNINHGLDEPSTYNQNKPSIVTEHSGHTFPVKSFDSIYRIKEGVLRHLRILDDTYKHKDSLGSICWCAFDYNTKRDFGSGDNICHHGVASIFRNEKDVSYVYSSQKDDEIILHPLGMFNAGDLDEARLNRILVLTNCDYISLSIGDEFVSNFYPDRQNYPNLKHPPIIIDDLIGTRFKDDRFNKKESKWVKDALNEACFDGFNNLSFKTKIKVGLIIAKYHLTFPDLSDLFTKYIGGWGDKNRKFIIKGYKDNKEVDVTCFSCFDHYEYSFRSNKYILRNESSYDTGVIYIKKVDQDGHILPYDFSSISVKTKGPIRLLGPSIINLEAGSTSIYVASTLVKKEEEAKLILEGEFGTKEIKFIVR